MRKICRVFPAVWLQKRNPFLVRNLFSNVHELNLDSDPFIFIKVEIAFSLPVFFFKKALSPEVPAPAMDFLFPN